MCGLLFGTIVKQDDLDYYDGLPSGYPDEEELCAFRDFFKTLSPRKKA